MYLRKRRRMFKDLKLKGSQRKGLDQINHDIKESLLYFLILYSQRIYKYSGSSFVLIITILLWIMILFGVIFGSYVCFYCVQEPFPPMRYLLNFFCQWSMNLFKWYFKKGLNSWYPCKVGRFWDTPCKFFF
jgi:hypothetical protein